MATESSRAAAVSHDEGMKHGDHVDLIRGGVEGAGVRWLELGCGDGEFTLALADLLGDPGEITAVDLDGWARRRLRGRLAERFPATTIVAVTADFT